MRLHLTFMALLALLATGCQSSTGPGTDELVLEVGRINVKVSKLTVEVDRLVAAVSMLTAEVAPRQASASLTTTFNPAPFLRQYLGRDIAELTQLPESFWEDRLNRARLGLMGGKPTYEDVVAEKEYYEGWLDYANWLRQNSDGLTRGLWQVGDEHLSRLDYLQLQLQWLLER